MKGIHKTICYAVSVAGLVATTTAAFATCPAATMNGTWQFFALQATSPQITPANQSVDTGNNTLKTIKVFPKSGGYENSTATAIKCEISVTGANANRAILNGTCSAQAVVAGDGGSGISVSGKVTLSSCTVTGGTLAVAADDTPVTFLGGHFNGTFGTGIASQGQPQVFLWTMIKN